MGAKQRRKPGQTLTCGWCQRAFPLLGTGRLPKYCGDTCRHRAWEHRRALSSKRTPGEVVVRTVQVENVSGSSLTIRRNGPGWTEALGELVLDLDRGRVYDRDLRLLAQELEQVLRSLKRRPAWSRYLR